MDDLFDFIECFTTTFLLAHSWLNWVDEDDDEDEVGLKEKPEDTRYIKIIPEAPGVWTKDLINFIPIYFHHWDSDKCRCVKPDGTYGDVKCPSRRPPTTGP